ncbi:MAG: histidine kinase [Eubacteriales bacterium]|nr:histidine kinase [Eubacteriales bacterium]
MGIQEKDWGSIEWMDNGEEGLFQKGLNVGIVTLRTGAHQQAHVHYEEQVFYVIQGQAISLINGEKVSLSAGKFFRWPAGVTHEIFNIGNIPFQHLLISNPSGIDLDQFLEEKKVAHYLTEKQKEDLLFMAVEAVRTQFLETLPYAYAIFDLNGRLVSRSVYQTEFCRKNCGAGENDGCPCMVKDKNPEDEKERMVSCPKGMTLFCIPVFFSGNYLGHIQGGYIYQSQQITETLQEVYDTPESTAIGIRNLLKKIAKAIKNYCEFEEFRRELLDREMKINNSREKQRILMTSLKKAEYAVTDLKINNHFLFNTLNSMASMALDGGQMSLYQSIVNLSKMFHYTLRNQSNIVPLSKEMEFLRAYLQLQKLRYGENLHVEDNWDKSFGEYLVPFHFLQPIVENAFVHGFGEEENKYLKISFEKSGKYLKIVVQNSGKSMDEALCSSINKAMKSNTSHGISMIYHKLSSIYGKDFHFMAIQDEEGGCFSMEIPVLDRKEGIGDDTCSDL